MPITQPIIEIDQDDLFPEQATQHTMITQPRIVCLVCRRPGLADMSRPLICDRCGADLPGARALVSYLLVNAEKDLDRAYDAWIEARDTAAPTTRAHYEMYQEFRQERTLAEVYPDRQHNLSNIARANMAEHKARSGEAGPVFDLIRLWLAKDAAGEHWTAVNEWAIKCDEVLG